MYTEESVNKLIEAVSSEFSAYLAKAEANASDLAKSEGTSEVVDGVLAKAEDEKSDKAEDKKEDKKEPKSEEKPAAEAKEAPKGEEAPAKEEGKEAEAAPAEEAPAAEAAPAADAGHGYDAEDLAALEQMYSSMSSEELRVHHDAIKAVLDGMQAAQAAPAAPAADAAAPAAPAPMAKSEEATNVVESAPVAEVELLKSEGAVKDAQIAELKKSNEVLAEFVSKILTKKAAPSAKAITSLETIAKSEGGAEVKELSKGEITAILTKKAADPSLAKSDRDLINAFYLTNGTSINSISHLLR